MSPQQSRRFQARSTNIALEPPTRKRRVPDALRQRIEISCDRCKKRKRRCIRQNDEESCAACSEAGAECTSTLPRKRRALAPQPSQRYAALDAIVRKLYPDEEIDSIGGLHGLAEKLGVEVPQGIGVNGDGNGDYIPPSSPVNHPSSFDNPELPPEGYLVPAPRGGHHYVGPASLVYFAKCARHLVARSNSLKRPAYDEKGWKRYMQAAEFTKYKVSHTIEANIQGHPATFAAGNEESPSVPSPMDIRSRPSPGGDAFRNARLPDRTTGDRLVNAFFERVQHNFPVLHRGTFKELYDASFSQHVDRSSEPGEACLLYMVFTLGAQALEDVLPESQTLQQSYLSIVIRDGLGRLVLTSTLANVQALLLLSLYQHNAGERNTAWILIGQAMRAAVAMGLHRDGENCDFNPFERNIRRMVWWSLHIIEQTVSLALGRPSFSDVINVNANFPDAAFETGVGLPVDYMRHYVGLTHFIVKIKKLNAILSVHYQEPRRLVERYASVMAIHAEIITWKKSLPRTLSLGQTFETPLHRRMVLLLLIWADYLESVLCRPYLLARVHQDLEQATRPNEIDEVAELSVAAAHASATKLLILADHNLLESSVWLDFYCAQHAIMIISLHFLGQPECEEWDDSRDSISRLIAVSQNMRLAPTYRITMNVALQLSCIAGVGPELPVTIAVPTSSSPERLLDTTAIPTQQPLTEAQLFEQFNKAFGPVPPAIHQAEPAMYSDLYNLGYMAESSNPWDFFDLASFNADNSHVGPEPAGNGSVTKYMGQIGGNEGGTFYPSSDQRSSLT